MLFRPLQVIRNVAAFYKPYDNAMRGFFVYRKISNWLRFGYFQLTQRNAIIYRSFFEKSMIRKNTVLFESFWGRSISCNPYSIFLGMKDDSRFQDWTFIWVTNPKTKVPNDIFLDHRVTLVDHQSRAYQHALATVQVLVNNTTFPTYFIRRAEQQYINTYHGIPLKKMGFDIDDTLASIANTQRNFIQATTLLSGGDYTDRFLYEPYGAITLFKKRILHSGFPRIDQSQRPASPELFAQLEVSGERKVLLFAPTWRGNAGSYGKGLSNLIQETAKLSDELSGEFDVFVSFHNLVLHEAELFPESIRLVPAELDINTILSAVDILVSDYSSVMIDFLALDRPIILYVPDKADYEKTRGLYFDLNALPAKICSTLDDVVSAAKNSIRPSQFETYQLCRDLLIPNQDGRATHRVLDAIIEPRMNAKIVDKKRILISMNSLGSNGITTSFLNLVSKIDHDKIEVYIITDARSIDASNIKFSNFSKIDPRCYKILRIGQQVLDLTENRVITNINEPTATFDFKSKQIKSAAFSREVLRLVSEERFDAVIDFAGYSPLWAHTMAAATADQKVIFQHNDLYAEYTNSDKNHTKLIGVFRAYAEFDTISPVSAEIGFRNFDALEKFYHAKDQIIPVRNVINVERVRQLSLEPIDTTCPPMSAYLNSSIIKLVTLGRLSPEKNQSRLLHAFSQSRQKGLNAVLFIAGDGPLKDSLVSLTKELNLLDDVIFLGQVDNPFPLIKAADYFVLSSDYEGQPMTLLEALTLGTHCIGTDIPGIRAVLGETQEIMTKPTVDSLATTLLALQHVAIGSVEVTFDAESYTQSVLQEFDVAVFGKT